MTIQPVRYYPQPVPAPRRVQGLSWLVHGNAKAGKSTFADSGPRPRIVLDVEGSSYWTPSEKTYWDPMRQTVPDPREGWDTAIVLVRNAETVAQVLQVLNSGQHPFNSGAMDSVTEVQQRIIDQLTAGRQMDRDKWGALLRQVNGMVRAYRDLITHPVRPLWAMTFVAGTKYDERTRKWRPMVQGQAQDYLPYYVDILGYIGALPDNSRQMLIGPHPGFETGERVGGRLPPTMLLGYPGRPGYTIEDMLRQVLTPQRNGR